MEKMHKIGMDNAWQIKLCEIQCPSNSEKPILHVSGGIRPTFQVSNSNQQMSSYGCNCPSCAHYYAFMFCLWTILKQLHTSATVWCFTCFTQRMAHLRSFTSFSLLHMQCIITLLSVLIQEPHILIITKIYSNARVSLSFADVIIKSWDLHL